MKKILIISSFLLVILSFSMIGYHVVSANEKVVEIKDILEVQYNKESYLIPYGYTLDNPNIVVDPYGTSPLTAMILFETETPQETTITIPGLTPETTITNTFESTTKHIIPIYGLYPNTENQVHLTCGTIKKTYSIKTASLPTSILPETNTATSQLTILNKENTLYGLDSNRDIRWFYTNHTNTPPVLLSNQHLLIGTTNFIDSTNTETLIEIDLTGKIYKQYPLNAPYYTALETETSLYILSTNLIEIEKQTGQVKATYPLSNIYQNMNFNEDKTVLILSNQTQEYLINLKTKEQSTRNHITNFSNTITLNFYTTSKNYKITKGIKFSPKEETKQSKKNIFLINYKKIDEDYKKYNINIKQTTDYINLTGNFTKEDEVYLILDKFLDKRVYNIKDQSTIINHAGLSGKYSIYIKINHTIYKTNTYINI